VIRDATAADAAAVAALWNHYIRDTVVTFNWAEKPAEEVAGLIAARQAAGHGFLVAEAGALLGFATYAQFRGGVGYARTMEHTILLDPAARGRGTGRALMEAVEDHARRGGAHSIFAGVSGANPEGRAFHAALGYGEVAILREVGRKRDLWLDLHLMQKFL
jgi:phosphinothricin acetyltransferase